MARHAPRVLLFPQICESKRVLGFPATDVYSHRGNRSRTYTYAMVARTSRSSATASSVSARAKFSPMGWTIVTSDFVARLCPFVAIRNTRSDLSALAHEDGAGAAAQQIASSVRVDSERNICVREWSFLIDGSGRA